MTWQFVLLAFCTIKIVFNFNIYIIHKRIFLYLSYLRFLYHTYSSLEPKITLIILTYNAIEFRKKFTDIENRIYLNEKFNDFLYKESSVEVQYIDVKTL